MRNMQVSENFERFATFSRASSVFISFFYFLRPFDDKILQGDILINIYTPLKDDREIARALEPNNLAI